MQMVVFTCPACGGSYSGPLTNRFITCEYCDTRFALSKDELEAIGFMDTDNDGFDDGDVPKRVLEADDSMAPMNEFAHECCKAFLKHADRSHFVSSGKIIRGLGIPESNEVYLIHDDTMFKSGKNGFAITHDGLYCREIIERSSHFVSWKELADAETLELDDSYIRLDGTSVCYFTDDDDLLEGELLKLYQKLFNHARKVV